MGIAALHPSYVLMFAANLRDRVAAILASGRSVTLVGQLDAPAGRIVQQVPVARWACGATVLAP